MYIFSFRPVLCISGLFTRGVFLKILFGVFWTFDVERGRGLTMVMHATLASFLCNFLLALMVHSLFFWGL